MNQTTSFNPHGDNYISTSDAAEVARLQQMSGAQGIGEPVYDQEYLDTMGELGLELPTTIEDKDMR